MKLKKRERNTVGILEWRSLRRRESATGCKDGFSCCGELDANTTDSSSITPPTTTPISLSLSLSLCVCVCVLVLLQRKRNEHTKGKGNAKEGINRRFLSSRGGTFGRRSEKVGSRKVLISLFFIFCLFRSGKM